ncbi:MAG: flagellar motor protein MotB, partial [bacterium]
PSEIESFLQTESKEMVKRKDERGIVIQITNRLLFEPGQVELSEEGQQVIERLSGILKHPGLAGRQIRVEGHTDNQSPEDYESNWQISVLRSSNVVELMINEFGMQPSRLSAVGFGSTRPISSNEMEKGRAQNRRVEIVILREDVEQD